MSLRTVTVSLLLVLLIISILKIPTTVVSQQYNDPDLENIRLFLYSEEGGNSLVFSKELVNHNPVIIHIGPDENITFSIQNVQERFFNPDIDAFLSIVTFSSISKELGFVLRCDGDGDGHFEYLIQYPEAVFWTGGVSQVQPANSSGEPVNMTNGIIELNIWRADNRSDNLDLQVNRDDCFVQIPFDLDTDGDGITDYSDEDNDGDGYPDEDDVFPMDPGEWKDSDGDGIGDNGDDDNNGNNVPDDLEIPIAMGLVLIPLVIIMAVMNRFKKKGKKEEGEWGEEDIPILTTSHEGPKNW
jgi:hypothetical protein